MSTSVFEVCGTMIASDTPHAAAGINSIYAMEVATMLACRFQTPQTVLFDHPTLNAIVSFIAAQEVTVAAVTAVGRISPIEKWDSFALGVQLETGAVDENATIISTSFVLPRSLSKGR